MKQIRKSKSKTNKQETSRIAERDHLVTKIQTGICMCERVLDGFSNMVKEYAVDKLSKEKLLSAAEIIIRLMIS